MLRRTNFVGLIWCKNGQQTHFPNRNYFVFHFVLMSFANKFLIIDNFSPKSKLFHRNLAQVEIKIPTFGKKNEKLIDLIVCD